LIDSKPERDLAEVAPSELTIVAQARGLRVGYSVPRRGVVGWFRRGEFVAVQGADFQIEAGRTLGIMGESGSGKSSLALATLGLLPSTGELRLGELSWGASVPQNQRMRRTMQVVFQDPFSSLSPRLTVEEIVGEGLLVHEPALSPAGRRERVLAGLREVGLGTEGDALALLRRYPHEFSGGQRQRLAIARALIIRPDILVLDEPTSALDVTIQKQVLTLLQRLQRERGLSYLLITHDVAVIRAMAHHVLVMKDGLMVESGTVTEVLQRPVQAYTRQLLAAAD
jgi:microcin C transport system ATP-binding protein